MGWRQGHLRQSRTEWLHLNRATDVVTYGGGLVLRSKRTRLLDSSRNWGGSAAEPRFNYRRGLLGAPLGVPLGLCDRLAAIRTMHFEPIMAIRFTQANLRAIMPDATSTDIQTYIDPLNETIRKFAINTPVRAAAFIAQVAHESGQLYYKEEIASGAAYEGRTDLGNTEPGDGRRYKGRGLIQLTGRFNYRQAGQALGLPLEENPDRVVQDPYTNAAVAGWYWDSRYINTAADAGDFERVTRLINGGLNGYDDRYYFWQRAQDALKDAPSTIPAASGTTNGPWILEIIVPTPAKPQLAMSQDLIRQGYTLTTLSKGTYQIKNYEEIQRHFWVQWDQPDLVSTTGSDQAYIYTGHATIQAQSPAEPPAPEPPAPEPPATESPSEPSPGPVSLSQIQQTLDINNSDHGQAAIILYQHLPEDVLQKLETSLDPETLNRVRALMDDVANATVTPSPPSTPAVPILAVPYYSQHDNYTMPSRTSNSSSCAMAAKFLGANISGDDEYLETVLKLGDTTDHGVQTQALATMASNPFFIPI